MKILEKVSTANQSKLHDFIFNVLFLPGMGQSQLDYDLDYGEPRINEGDSRYKLISSFSLFFS